MHWCIYITKVNVTTFDNISFSWSPGQQKQTATELNYWANAELRWGVCECVCFCAMSTFGGNNPRSVCFSWLSEQEAETPARVCVHVCLWVSVCVCIRGTLRWLLFSCQPSGCSLCPLLFFICLHCACIFASLCMCLCVSLCTPGASCLIITSDRVH